MCTGCGQTLRVGDEHAGKKARCPNCGAIASVPPTDAAPPTPAAERPFADTDYVGESTNPFADVPGSSPNPYQSPSTVKPVRYQKPHRGGTILTLGILGIVCCGPLGIAAWVMGSSDLKEIRAGRMDPSGRGLTQAGMVVGIIATVLLIISALFQVGMLVANAA